MSEVCLHYEERGGVCIHKSREYACFSRVEMCIGMRGVVGILSGVVGILRGSVHWYEECGISGSLSERR